MVLFKVVNTHKKTILYPIVLLVVNFIVARSLFSGYANFVETRYTIAVIPIMEILVIMFYLRMEYIKPVQELNNKENIS
jgi:hypothetical protein